MVSEKGFTLIEVLISMVIVLILFTCTIASDIAYNKSMYKLLKKKKKIDYYYQNIDTVFSNGSVAQYNMPDNMTDMVITSDGLIFFRSK